MAEEPARGGARVLRAAQLLLVLAAGRCGARRGCPGWCSAWPTVSGNLGSSP